MSGHAVEQRRGRVGVERVGRRGSSRSQRRRSAAPSAAQLARAALELLDARAPARPARAVALRGSRARCRRSRPGSGRAPAGTTGAGRRVDACSATGGEPSRAATEAALGEQAAQVLVQRRDAVVVEARRDWCRTPASPPASCRTPRGCAPAGGARRAARRPRPRRSNLLMATTSAKSSMSIFSSCDAAPNSGVMTYSGDVDVAARWRRRPGRCPTSRRSPGRSPAALQAAMTSGEARRASRAEAARGQRPQEDAGRRSRRVHADAVAEQRAAARAAGRVDGEHGDRAACPPGPAATGGPARR